MILSKVGALEYIPDFLGVSIVFITDSFFLQLTVKVLFRRKLCVGKLGWIIHIGRKEFLNFTVVSSGNENGYFMNMSYKK